MIVVLKMLYNCAEVAAPLSAALSSTDANPVFSFYSALYSLRSMLKLFKMCDRNAEATVMIAD